MCMYLSVRIKVRGRVRVGVRANSNLRPNPLRVAVLVEDLSLLPFSITFRDNLELQ